MSAHFWQGRWRGRTPAGDNHRRAREVISPSGGIMRGRFPSRKNGRMVHYEGLLELDAIYLFEASPRVARYREQPTTIHYPDGPRLRRYTPDFELLLVTGEILLVEVKPIRSLADSDIRYKLDCVATHLRRVHTPFVILTDTRLREEPRQSSLRWLYHRTPRIPPTPEAMRVARHKHRSHFPSSIREASTVLADCGVDPYSLLFAGLLWCSLEAPVSLDTQVNLSTELGNDWFCVAPEYGF
ncbi:TnsA endonuclease N-terminal domain-containing protein [Ralstonia holmesii]|uniref:TnsA endonuclease N-terminal domain-containing protein n=1 Tax=Ralstonia holmesii TaxID=3058602 RepID=UPI0028F52376|nr:TnsA endonuclease N-terminal domain-containing protein [Ralstonia sp. LMG 32967]CAJ0691475.1 hypothetical protein R11007_01549 [Ralstonia sp. LMG 32967]